MYKEKKVSVIIAAAGSASRMAGVSKQYLEIGGMAVLARAAKAFERNAYTDEIIIAVRAGDEEKCRREIVEQYNLRKVSAVIAGGSDRQHTVMRALDVVSPDARIILVHDGARPFVTQRVIHDVIDGAEAHGACVPCVSVKDTIKIIKGNFISETPDRSLLRAVQTPQGFAADLLKDAYRRIIGEEEKIVTDDASVVEAFGHEVFIVESDETNIKITTQNDILTAELIAGGGMSEAPHSQEPQEKKEEIKEQEASQECCEDKSTEGVAENVYSIPPVPVVGIGYDVHAFAEGRKLVLGGVEIPYEKGIAGHSDADVLIHAVMDALLGAAGLGDIGVHFPDTDDRYEGISSLKLLEETRKMLLIRGWRIANIDVVVIAQKPKISSYVMKMREKMGEVLKLSASKINIKGTTTEGLGFTGREEGIAAQAVVCMVQTKLRQDF